MSQLARSAIAWLATHWFDAALLAMVALALFWFPSSGCHMRLEVGSETKIGNGGSP